MAEIRILRPLPEIDDARLRPALRTHTRRAITRACAACGRKTENGARRCTDCAQTAVVYDAAHQRSRAARLPLAIGTACPICTETLHADQALDLDHDTNAITHASCNRSNGAAITNA